MLLITCMDSRLCPTSFTQADPGDMFIVRNPGNFMPHNQLFGENHHSVLSERAALELAISTGVQHIAVCGHSDCKVTPLAWWRCILMLTGAHNEECMPLMWSVMYCVLNGNSSSVQAVMSVSEIDFFQNSYFSREFYSLLGRSIV